MSRLDHSKVKTRERGARGEKTTGRWNTDGWRTEYPVVFPVVRRSMYDPRQGSPNPTDNPNLDEGQVAA